MTDRDAYTRTQESRKDQEAFEEWIADGEIYLDVANMERAWQAALDYERSRQ